MAAYVQIAHKWYIGAAADTKPTGVELGSHAIEYDTDKEYITYDGTNWVQKDTLVKLVAGTALVGTVGIDQTTPGSTNNVAVTGMGEVQASPTANTLLARIKDLLTGIVLAASTNVIGWVKRKRDIVETQFTGTGDLAVGTSKIAPATAFKLVAIELHLNAAPTTGAQNLVITKDDGTGAAYDGVLLTLDLVANAVTDLRIEPNLLCKATDVITAAWTNTDTKTYGLTFKHELV